MILNEEKMWVKQANLGSPSYAKPMGFLKCKAPQVLSEVQQTTKPSLTGSLANPRRWWAEKHLEGPHSSRRASPAVGTFT